jgi:hypothetical protein
MKKRIARKIVNRITDYIADWEHGYIPDSYDEKTGIDKYPYPRIYEESLALVCKKFKYKPEQVDVALKKTFKTGVHRGIYRQIFYPCDECEEAEGCMDNWPASGLPEEIEFCDYHCCYYCGQCRGERDYSTYRTAEETAYLNDYIL